MTAQNGVAVVADARGIVMGLHVGDVDLGASLPQFFQSTLSTVRLNSPMAQKRAAKQAQQNCDSARRLAENA